MNDTAGPVTRAQRRPRADGERTRGAILRAAASLATVDGLEGLSIGNLAAAIGMSKSGLYAHFALNRNSSSPPCKRRGGSSPTK
jgi:Bacterial regulatory proteins, tetR family